jgi:hypothetical protein
MNEKGIPTHKHFVFKWQARHNSMSYLLASVWLPVAPVVLLTYAQGCFSI